MQVNLTDKPAIIVLSSHVVRGTVGNRAAAFALEVLGFPVWIVPTVILPWHPGHGPATRSVPDANDFSAMIDDLVASPFLGEAGAILSGYLGADHQVACVAKLIDALRKVNPGALIGVDPVIGDHGRLYVPESQAMAMRDHLLPRADIITPNPYELGWLNGSDTATDIPSLVRQAAAMNIGEVLCTSPPFEGDNDTGLVSCSSTEGERSINHRQLPSVPNGLGDLTAALYLAHCLNGYTRNERLRRTASSVLQIAADAYEAKSDELRLESEIGALLNPSAPVRLID